MAQTCTVNVCMPACTWVYERKAKCAENSQDTSIQTTGILVLVLACIWDTIACSLAWIGFHKSDEPALVGVTHRVPVWLTASSTAWCVGCNRVYGLSWFFDRRDGWGTWVWTLLSGWWLRRQWPRRPRGAAFIPNRIMQYHSSRASHTLMSFYACSTRKFSILPWWFLCDNIDVLRNWFMTWRNTTLALTSSTQLASSE